MTHPAIGCAVISVALVATVGIAGHATAAPARSDTAAAAKNSAVVAGAEKRAPDTHKVQSGEVLGSIAKKVGCTVEQLKRANRLKSSDLIKVGQALKIPKCKGRRSKGEGRPKLIKHVVVKGDTLSGIAEHYAADVASIRKRNKLKGNLIRKCKVLTILPGKAVEERAIERYRIGAGDTLDRIARRYRTTISEILCLNPKVKDPRRIRIGDRLKLMRHGPVHRSSAVGRPQKGKLIHGEQLPPGPGYFRRRPNLAWGTNETITGLRQAIEAVRNKHRKVHKVAVGDISARHGGKLRRHKSHQSGRDVDLGLYFKGQRSKGPEAFISGLRHKLDLPANWTLLKALVSHDRRSSLVSYIFLDYRLQQQLYQWAKKQGVAQKTLDWMFQYPRGRRAMRGVIRHEPGHADHYHIRFKCPEGDEDCI